MKKTSAGRRPAVAPVLRRRRGVPANPAWSGEIQRNLQLHGEVGRNLEPHGSAVDCVESAGNPAESRRVADPPSGRKGVRFREFRPVGRNSAESRPKWGDMAESRTSRSCCRLRTISSGNPEKSRTVADPPAGRFYGEGEGFRGIPPWW